MRAIAVGALLICFSAMLGGQAEKPASGRWYAKKWDKNTGRITIWLPTAKISAASSQSVSASLTRLKDAEIETEGMILKAEEVELTISTMEADIRGAHLKFEKRK